MDIPPNATHVLVPIDAYRRLTNAGVTVPIAGSVAMPRSYEVTRSPRGPTYADVVWREVHEEEFTLRQAVEVIGPLIQNTTRRLRDQVRRALKSDVRFEQIPADETTFRRTPTESAVPEADDAPQ